MAAPKMTMALATLLLSGAFAVHSHADGQSTVTVEPQQIGTTTSDGIVMYSMNCCTIVESTQCHVSISTATNAGWHESSAVYSAPVAESTAQAGSAATSAIGETIIPGEPVPTSVVTEVAPGAPQTTTGQPETTVISTTDSLGNPTLETSSVLAAVTSGMLSATGSMTGMHHPNSTATLTHDHDGPSGSMTAPSAPDQTNVGTTLKALPGMAFGVVFMAMAYLV